MISYKYCYLFDGWPGVVLRILVQITLRILTTLARVTFGINTIHGHCQGRVCFIWYTAKTHSTWKRGHTDNSPFLLQWYVPFTPSIRGYLSGEETFYWQISSIQIYLSLQLKIPPTYGHFYSIKIYYNITPIKNTTYLRTFLLYTNILQYHSN